MSPCGGGFAGVPFKFSVEALVVAFLKGVLIVKCKQAQEESGSTAKGEGAPQLLWCLSPRMAALTLREPLAHPRSLE